MSENILWVRHEFWQTRCYVIPWESCFLLRIKPLCWHSWLDVCMLTSCYYYMSDNFKAQVWLISFPPRKDFCMTTRKLVWCSLCYTYMHGIGKSWCTHASGLQWNLSTKDLWNKDTCLIRTAVPATLRSVQNNLWNQDTLGGPKGVCNREGPRTL